MGDHPRGAHGVERGNGFLGLLGEHDVVFAEHVADVAGEHLGIDEGAHIRGDAEPHPVVTGASAGNVLGQRESRRAAEAGADIGHQRLLRIPMPVPGDDGEGRDRLELLATAELLDRGADEGGGLGRLPHLPCRQHHADGNPRCANIHGGSPVFPVGGNSHELRGNIGPASRRPRGLCRVPALGRLVPSLFTAQLAPAVVIRPAQSSAVPASRPTGPSA